MASILRNLIDPKVLRILDLFSKNTSKLYHLKKISLDSNVPLGTTFRIVNKLVKLNVLEIVAVNKLKLYKFSINNKTKELTKL
jgi:DNA-binding IclR family transcriptional regulator